MKLKDVFNQEYEWEEVYLEERDDKSWVIVNDGEIVFGGNSALCFGEAKMFAIKLARTVNWEDKTWEKEKEEIGTLAENIKCCTREEYPADLANLLDYIYKTYKSGEE